MSEFFKSPHKILEAENTWVHKASTLIITTDSSHSPRRQARRVAAHFVDEGTEADRVNNLTATEFMRGYTTREENGMCSVISSKKMRIEGIPQVLMAG